MYGMEAFRNTITPVLNVRHAAQAVAFYERAFGAHEIYRNTYPDGRIVVEMAVGDARFRVADEAPEAFNLSPQALGGHLGEDQPAGRRPRRARGAGDHERGYRDGADR